MHAHPRGPEATQDFNNLVELVGNHMMHLGKLLTVLRASPPR